MSSSQSLALLVFLISLPFPFILLFCFPPAFTSPSSFFYHHPSLLSIKTSPPPVRVITPETEHSPGTAALACSPWLLALCCVKCCLSVQGNETDLFCSYNLISALSKGPKQATARSACPQWDIAGENSGLLVLSLALVPIFSRTGPHQLTVDLLNVVLRILICLEYFLLFIHLVLCLSVCYFILSFIYWGYRPIMCF